MKRLPNLLKSEIEKGSHLQFRLNQQDLLFHFILTKDFRPWSEFSNCSPLQALLKSSGKTFCGFFIKSLSRLLKVIQGQSAISFIQALLYRIMYLFPNLNDIFSHNPITFTYCSRIFIPGFMYMTLNVMKIGGNTCTKGNSRILVENDGNFVVGKF